MLVDYQRLVDSNPSWSKHYADWVKHYIAMEIDETRCRVPSLSGMMRILKVLACSMRMHRLRNKCKRKSVGNQLTQIYTESGTAHVIQQENSAKLTNQRVSCAFTSSPFSFHVRHILPTSKFQDSYSCILLIFLQTSVNNMCENCDCDYSTQVWRFLFRNPSE